MIIDKRKNLLFYKELIPKIDNALKKLESLTDDSEGQYEFDGGFLLIVTGTTKYIKEGYFETHKKYIDVQIILEGSEKIAWSEISDLKNLVPYNSKTDCEFFEGSNEHYIKISKDMFYVVFPHDGHKPTVHVNNESSFRKCIIKLEK